MKRPGLADATDLHRHNQIPFSHQCVEHAMRQSGSLLPFKFHPVGFDSFIVDIENCRQNTGLIIRHIHPCRNVNARFREELDLFNSITLARCRDDMSHI